MRLFAVELNNDIKGIPQRKQYMESILSKLQKPDVVVFPELALCSYMACQKIWEYADDAGRDTSEWAVDMARKYHIYIGVGYLDREDGDYYNRYMIAGPDGVCGVVTKSEGETAVFKNGSFGNIIETPFGKVGVAICYDAKRKHFYDNVKDQEICLILFPHGCPANPRKPVEEKNYNDNFCGKYADAFGVPVAYVNSTGKLEYMPGKMGWMMAKAGFRMNGYSKIYSKSPMIKTGIPGAIAVDVELRPQGLAHPIRFYGKDLVKGNWLFRWFILRSDAKAGLRMYERNRFISR